MTGSFLFPKDISYLYVLRIPRSHSTPKSGNICGRRYIHEGDTISSDFIDEPSMLRLHPFVDMGALEVGEEYQALLVGILHHCVVEVNTNEEVPLCHGLYYVKRSVHVTWSSYLL